MTTKLFLFHSGSCALASVVMIHGKFFSYAALFAALSVALWVIASMDDAP